MSSAFDFDGKNIGRRALDALARQAKTDDIELSCRGARFRDAVDFRDITFARIDAEGATFEHGLKLCNCRVIGDVRLDRIGASRVGLKNVTMAGAALLREMTVASLSIQSVSLEGYASFDQSSVSQLTLRDVTFGAEARFRAVYSEHSATFNRVRFRDVSSFRGSSWSALLFKTCVFSGATDFDHLDVDAFSLLESRMHDLRKLDLFYCRLCRLRWTTFEQPLIVYAANEIDASDAIFERGLNLSLREGTRLMLERASLRGAGLITTTGDPNRVSPAKLASLDGARLEQLTLRELDLSACIFAHAHTLDEVIISGSQQLAMAPRVLPWAAPREVLADEVDYRHGREQQRNRHLRRWRRSDAGSEDTSMTLAEKLPWLDLGNKAPALQPAHGETSYRPSQPTPGQAPDEDHAWLETEIDATAGQPISTTETPGSPSQPTPTQTVGRGEDWVAEFEAEIEARDEIEARADSPTPSTWRRGLQAAWQRAAGKINPQQWRERRARGRWHRPDADDKAPTDPLIIAETYRALRRGRERARDWPGAADFYYGEMEMRRASARTLGDRLVLFTYWLVSGYGLRASRSCAAYLTTVLALAAILDLWAVQKPVSFAYVLSYVFATTTVLARPAVTLSLNTLGGYIEVLARLTGPTFFTLTLLALRARVRR